MRSHPTTGHLRPFISTLITNARVLFVSFVVGMAAACSSEGSRAVVAVPPPGNGCGAPLRIVAIQDITASGMPNITPIATVADLDPLITVVAKCGGEIGFGFIQARSNRPLVRYYVAKPVPTPPMPPSFSGPAFQVSKQKRLYAAKLAAYNSAESARVQDAEERATRFRAELATLLATPATVRSTDVWGAIARCSQFHGEPAQGDSSASSQYRNYSLVISDMADNVGAKPVGALPGEFLIVNGAPVLASLNSLHPRRFESVAAAVRYVTGGP